MDALLVIIIALVATTLFATAAVSLGEDTRDGFRTPDGSSIR